MPHSSRRSRAVIAQRSGRTGSLSTKSSAGYANLLDTASVAGRASGSYRGLQSCSTRNGPRVSVQLRVLPFWRGGGLRGALTRARALCQFHVDDGSGVNRGLRELSDRDPTRHPEPASRRKHRSAGRTRTALPVARPCRGSPRIVALKASGVASSHREIRAPGFTAVWTSGDAAQPEYGNSRGVAIGSATLWS